MRIATSSTPRLLPGDSVAENALLEIAKRLPDAANVSITQELISRV